MCEAGWEIEGLERALDMVCEQRDAARAEAKRWQMKYGRMLAANAVWMQFAAYLARNGQQELAQKWQAKADAAAANVREEDFVVAKPQ